MLSSLYYSFTNYSMGPTHKWIGFRNFFIMFNNDSLFYKTVYNTLYYALISVPLNLVLGVGVALLMNQKIRGIRLIRTIYYLPNVVSGVAIAFLWQMLLQSNNGIINQGLALLGIKGPAWLSDAAWQKPALILTNCWNAGGAMVIYLASLKGVPTVYYEAAEIDGANSWVKLTRITLPMISPSIFYNLVMGVIGALQVFTNAKLMTGSGTENATTFYCLALYNNAFVNYRMGYACAMAWVLLITTLILTLLVFKVFGNKVYYETGENK